MTWELQKADVPITINQAGIFTVKTTGLLYSIKLVRKSGEFTYKTETVKKTSYWGRWTPSTSIRIIITRSNREQLLPTKDKIIIHKIHGKYYKLAGFTTISPYIAIHSILDPVDVTEGDELQIWHLDEGKNQYTADSGIIVDVSAIII